MLLYFRLMSILSGQISEPMTGPPLAIHSKCLSCDKPLVNPILQALQTMAGTRPDDPSSTSRPVTSGAALRPSTTGANMNPELSKVTAKPLRLYLTIASNDSCGFYFVVYG